MHIIFGNTVAEELKEKYTVLELDRLQIEPQGPVLDSYCILEKEQIPLDDVWKIENLQGLHNKLMENYRKKNWSFCEQALEHLRNAWGGTVNTFYDEISSRIAKYKEQDPGPDWIGVYEKHNRGS